MEKGLTQNLTQGPVLSGILHFSLPIILANLFQTIYNLADTAIVGRYLGLESLAAVGSTGSINFLIIGFVSGVCAGMTIPVAQQFGAGDYQRMRRYIFNAIILCVVFSVILTPLTVIYAHNIMDLMLTPDDIIEEATLYIAIILGGIPVTFLYNLSSGILRALGNSKTPLYYLIISSIVNILLDIFSVTVLKMDVRGPALATVVSQLLSGVLCVIYLCRKYPDIAFQEGEKKPELSLMKHLSGIGVPMGLQYSITAVGSVILQSAVNSLGSEVVAAVTVAGRIQMLIGNSEMDSLGTAMATYSGQNYGAGQYRRITEGVKKAIFAGCIYCFAAIAITYFFSNSLASLFITDSSSREIVIVYSHQMTMTVSFTFFLLCILSVLRFSIQGLGYSTVSLFSGIAELIARVLISLVFIPKYGYIAACYSNPLAWTFADITLIICWIPVIRSVRIKLKIAP